MTTHAIQRRILPVLFGTLLLDMIGVGMIFPIIPILFTDPSSSSFLLHGYSTTAMYVMAGVITSLFGLMQFIASPILGELSDVYGRKKLLIVGVSVLAVSNMVFGFGIQAASIALLLISRAIAGLAGANLSIVQASIADISAPHERAKNFGLIGAAFGIGFILGPLLGGWIAHTLNNAAAPFWCAGILGVINLAFLSLFLPETHKVSAAKHHFHILKGIHNIVAAFSDVDARPVYWANFLYMSGFAFFTSFIGTLLVVRFHMTAADIGTFFGVVGAWVVVTQLFILRILTRKYTERQILRYSFLSVAFAIAMYPFVPSVILLYAILPVMAIPQGLSFANLGALISKSVSADKQGAALGINGSLMALSQGVVPLIAGLGSGLLGLVSPFLAGSSLIVLAWFILFVFSRKR